MWWRPVLALLALSLVIQVVPVLAADCGCGGSSGSDDSMDSSVGGGSSGYGSSSDPSAVASAAWDLYTKGLFQEALQGFNDSLALDPYNIPALMGKAEVLFTLHRYPEAAEIYRKVVVISPSHDGAYFSLGNTLLVMGDYEDAAEAYERSLAIRPGNRQAEQNLRIARSYLGERVPTEMPTTEPIAPAVQVSSHTPLLPDASPTSTLPPAPSSPFSDGCVGILSLVLSMSVAFAGRRYRR